MIVSFANILKAYSGKCDGLVYMYNRRLNKVIARRMPAFKPHAGTDRLSTIAHNLKAPVVFAEGKNLQRRNHGQHGSRES